MLIWHSSADLAGKLVIMTVTTRCNPDIDRALNLLSSVTESLQQEQQQQQRHFL